MGFLRAPLGVLVTVLVLLAGVLLGIAAFQVDRVTRPRRVPTERIDFDAMMLRVEEVEFLSTDGVRLRGWLFPGPPGASPILLAHDLGASKSSLVHLAVVLSKEGFAPLAFDFRGHGESGGERSTLGLRERRDIVGAVEMLSRRGDVDARQMGIYGVGMGAHAAVLAAADSPALRVLVLDGLYPDAGYPLSRELFGGWGFGRRHLAFVPVGIFTALSQTRVARQRAEDELARLLGRDVLLLASERDPVLRDAIKSMYHEIPQQTDVDGNLVLMPATAADGLYGESLSDYQREVAGFFRARLGTRD